MADITFPIPPDLLWIDRGATIAKLHALPEVAGEFRQGYTGRLPETDSMLQEFLYKVASVELLHARLAPGANLYAPSWFLLGYHGWLALAKQRGAFLPERLRAVDDLSVLRPVLHELGIDASKQEIWECLSDVPLSGRDTADHADIDAGLYWFSELVDYLSCAAVRNGRHLGLNAPAASVFISYSREDERIVNRLRVFLEMHAVDVWLDSTDLKSADPFAARLSSGIEQQECLVVVLTDAALRSRWVAAEIACALDLECRILPLAFVPIGELSALREHEDGERIHDGIMSYHIESAVDKSPNEVFESVLSSLQEVGPELTRWSGSESNVMWMIESLGGLRSPK